MYDKKIAIIGCGNLGLSIVNGLIEKKATPPSNITATRRNLNSIQHLTEFGINITSNNQEAVRASEIIIIALKPYNVIQVLNELSPLFNAEKHVIVSLATGISTEQLSNSVGNIPVFRAMPNTAADVGSSMTCISSTCSDTSIRTIVENCFKSIGEVIFIDEKLMDASTVLGACGIAFALRFIRGMIQGGIQIGFDAKTASDIVTQTVKGAAELLIERNEHPEYEIDKVTTPKGCTISGLNEMEHNGFSSALIKGIVNSYNIIEK